MTGHRLSIASPVGPAAHQSPPSDLRIQRPDLITLRCAGSVPSGRFGIWQAVPGKFHLGCPHNQPSDPVTDGQDLVRVNLIPLGWPHRSACALLYVSHPASAIASVFRGRLCAPSECRRGATHIGSTHTRSAFLLPRIGAFASFFALQRAPQGRILGRFASGSLVRSSQDERDLAHPGRTVRKPDRS
jgi:hypothetical protein